MMSFKAKFQAMCSMPVSFAAVLLMLSMVTSCSEEFDRPPMVLPTASHIPNMSIADFKAQYWREAVNYVDTVNQDIVIHGWVTSSDESGNVYKKIYLQDESGMGMTIAINQSGLYEKYRIGQELVLNLRGGFVGKFNGQQELGYPDTANYRKYGSWRMSFMAQPMWESMAELNGFFTSAKVDTMVIELSDLSNKHDANNLMRYQGTLVRINGVSFKEADGKQVFAPEGNNYTNRNLIDANGRTLTVRTSSHAVFASTPLPEGPVDVVGLLDFYSTSNNASGVWQLSLRSINDVICFTR